MINCLFYGNCQTNALCKIFKNIINYNFIEILPVHKLTQKDIDHVYSILPTINILITQHVSDNYKNNAKLSSKSIISATNKTCKIIFIPNCYFDFYYPNLSFLDSNDDTLQEHYHDKLLLKLYLSNKYNSKYLIIKKYLEFINNNKIYDEKYLLSKAYLSLCEMKKRENEKHHDVKISDFIEKNYKDKLLFYTTNHPTKVLLNFICEQICQILNINYVEQNIDPMENKKVPIHSSLQKVVKFNIYNFIPIINNNIGYGNVANYLLDLYDENKFNFAKFFTSKILIRFNKNKFFIK
jgi:hypothetical protein